MVDIGTAVRGEPAAVVISSNLDPEASVDGPVVSGSMVVSLSCVAMTVTEVVTPMVTVVVLLNSSSPRVLTAASQESGAMVGSTVVTTLV